MAATSAWIQGDRTPHDWRESWRVSMLDDATWHMLGQLRCEYEEFHQAIESHGHPSNMLLGAVTGAIARGLPPGPFARRWASPPPELFQVSGRRLAAPAVGLMGAGQPLLGNARGADDTRSRPSPSAR
ncbi:MAG: hypothetical protein DMG28_02040 [Acidobacteria bacterium]|nr:MAG: hypothetical protein DMG28_02040 [Acidobacteriota bacterium]